MLRFGIEMKIWIYVLWFVFKLSKADSSPSPEVLKPDDSLEEPIASLSPWSQVKKALSLSPWRTWRPNLNEKKSMSLSPWKLWRPNPKQKKYSLSPWLKWRPRRKPKKALSLSPWRKWRPSPKQKKSDSLSSWHKWGHLLDLHLYKKSRNILPWRKWLEGHQLKKSMSMSPWLNRIHRIKKSMILSHWRKWKPSPKRKKIDSLSSWHNQRKKSMSMSPWLKWRPNIKEKRAALYLFQVAPACQNLKNTLKQLTTIKGPPEIKQKPFQRWSNDYIRRRLYSNIKRSMDHQEILSEKDKKFLSTYFHWVPKWKPRNQCRNKYVPKSTCKVKSWDHDKKGSNPWIRMEKKENEGEIHKVEKRGANPWIRMEKKEYNPWIRQVKKQSPTHPPYTHFNHFKLFVPHVKRAFTKSFWEQITSLSKDLSKQRMNQERNNQRYKPNNDEKRAFTRTFWEQLRSIQKESSNSMVNQEWVGHGTNQVNSEMKKPLVWGIPHVFYKKFDPNSMDWDEGEERHNFGTTDMEASIKNMLMSKEMGPRLEDPKKEEMSKEIGSRLEDPNKEEMSKEMGSRFEDPAKEEMSKEMGSRLEDPTKEEMSKEMGSKLEDPAKEEMKRAWGATLGGGWGKRASSVETSLLRGGGLHAKDWGKRSQDSHLDLQDIFTYPMPMDNYINNDLTYDDLLNNDLHYDDTTNDDLPYDNDMLNDYIPDDDLSEDDSPYNITMNDFLTDNAADDDSPNPARPPRWWASPSCFHMFATPVSIQCRY